MLFEERVNDVKSFWSMFVCSAVVIGENEANLHARKAVRCMLLRDGRRIILFVFGPLPESTFYPISPPLFVAIFHPF